MNGSTTTNFQPNNIDGIQLWFLPGGGKSPIPTIQRANICNNLNIFVENC